MLCGALPLGQARSAPLPGGPLHTRPGPLSRRHLRRPAGAAVSAGNVLATRAHAAAPITRRSGVRQRLHASPPAPWAAAGPPEPPEPRCRSRWSPSRRRVASWPPSPPTWAAAPRRAGDGRNAVVATSTCRPGGDRSERRLDRRPCHRARPLRRTALRSNRCIRRGQLLRNDATRARSDGAAAEAAARPRQRSNLGTRLLQRGHVSGTTAVYFRRGGLSLRRPFGHVEAMTSRPSRPPRGGRRSAVGAPGRWPCLLPRRRPAPTAAKPPPQRRRRASPTRRERRGPGAPGDPSRRGRRHGPCERQRDGRRSAGTAPPPGPRGDVRTFDADCPRLQRPGLRHRGRRLLPPRLPGPGVDAASCPGIIDTWLQASSSGVTTSTATVGGKQSPWSTPAMRGPSRSVRLRRGCRRRGTLTSGGRRGTRAPSLEAARVGPDVTRPGPARVS